MALDEPKDEFTTIESNGVTAYIDPSLVQHLTAYGDINIDFVTNQQGQTGYQIMIGQGCDPGDHSCGDGTCG